jgi:hypothetical protein
MADKVLAFAGAPATRAADAAAGPEARVDKAPSAGVCAPALFASLLSVACACMRCALLFLSMHVHLQPLLYLLHVRTCLLPLCLNVRDACHAASRSSFNLRRGHHQPEAWAVFPVDVFAC